MGEKFEKICNDYATTLGKVFNKYKLAIIKEAKSIPLDYIMVLPPAVSKKIKSKTRVKIVENTTLREQLKIKDAEVQREHDRRMTQDEKE